MDLVMLAVLIIWVLLLHLYIFWPNRPGQACDVHFNGKSIGRLKVLRLTSPLRKRIGLLNHVKLSKGSGILLENTKRVHGKNMAFDWVAVFIDQDWSVVASPLLVRANTRTVTSPPNTRHVLEFSADDKQLLSQIQRGMKITFNSR